MLEAGADKISGREMEPDIDAADIASMLEAVSRLSKKVRDSALDQALKRILLDLLRAMEDSLVHYRARGNDGLRAEMQRAIGTIVMNSTMFQRNKDDESVKGFCNLLQRLMEIIPFANSVKEFVSQTLPVLLMLPPAS